jgi:hypothetical protein
MREDDGLRTAAGLFIKEVDAVDFDGRHSLRILHRATHSKMREMDNLVIERLP